MGWWRANRNGESLQLEETGLVWGDGPADIMDDAVMEIRKEFKNAYDRDPTAAEMRAGLEFTLMGLHDDDSLEELDA